ncbi:hypothetical protein Vadar_025639 [Vaccinium darrowii]|uniref:Uncharacterized protein n=1 Tax=Vaccinium darrowii TaxID=229202 RepID=A0ACB7Z6A8_9ERIC|nr:hypothetical protein Vadar_025639 [Vaccinium darrowii]
MLWNELRGLHFSVDSNPWLLMGDFNAVRRLNERSNPENFDYTAAASFNSCVADIAIDDLPAKVKSALDDFHSFSGLSPNLQKSAVYYSGVSSELKVLLEAILPIPQGHLPVRRPVELGHEISWAIHHVKKKGFSSALYKLAMAGTVYYIWKARNDSVFCNKRYSTDAIFDMIVKDVRDRASSWRKFGKSSANLALCRA